MNGQRYATGDMDFLKQTNRGLILNQLKQDGPLSRAELSRKVGLSRSTCSLLIDELLDNQLVVELGKDRSSGGRRPTLVDINYQAGRAIGIKVMATSIAGALVDLTGGVLRRADRSFSAEDGHEGCIAAICSLTEELAQGVAEAPAAAAAGRHGGAGSDGGSGLPSIDDHGAAGDGAPPILGIGIGMGGRIDYESGTLLESSVLPWTELPLAKLVAERTGIPVYLENDVNTFALGENHFGLGKAHSNYLCISIGRGIGAGILVEDRLYKGAHHGAGEFGHTKLIYGSEARRCSCGERGCLEAYASTPAILAEAERHFGSGVSIEGLMERARSGNANAATLFEDAGRFLGLGLSTLVNLFDPEVILVGGEGTVYADFIEQSLKQSLRENTVYNLAEEIPIHFLPYEPDMWARGLATVVMMERLQVAF